MQHFEREAKWMAAVFVLLVAAGVAAAFVVPNVLTQIDVDRCLDNGGRYDHAAAQCDNAIER
jgi:hypothetical protein